MWNSFIEPWKTHDRDLENENVLLRCWSCCPCKSWLRKILKPSFFLGFDYCSHFHLHGSIIPTHLSFSSSLLSLLSSPFSWSFFASFKWIPLQKLLPERSCTASTDLPGGFSVFTCSFIFCLFPCFCLICRTLSVTMAMLIITPLLDLWQHKQMDGWLGMSNALLLHANKYNLWRGSTNQRDINTSKPMLFPSVFRSHITGGVTQQNARVTLYSCKQVCASFCEKGVCVFHLLRLFHNGNRGCETYAKWRIKPTQ